MQHQVLCAEGEGTLDLAAKGRDAFGANFIGLAADINQVAGMDDQRADVELGAQLLHADALFGIDFGGAPHARAGGENLQGVCADFAGALDGVGCAAGCAEMNADALGHVPSLLDDEAAIGVHGIPSWNIGYPHPYFGRKILVFLRLQGGLRCKILKTKKFPAKYSWQRSYGTFRALSSAFG